MATILIAAAISAIGLIVAAGVAACQASRELVVKRQLDSTDRFLELVSILDNRASTEAGLGKQIATGWLIAEFGRNNPFLKKTAEETLKEYVVMYPKDTNSALNAGLVNALAHLGERPSLLPWSN